MKFNYTALSSDNQKLTGVLDSTDIDAAREELHQMGVSIITINEISEEEFINQKKTEETKKTEGGIITYIFEAIDNNGKSINGTIDAKDSYSAFKRLIIDYSFKINALYPSNANSVVIEASKKDIPIFEAKVKEEGIDISKTDSANNLDLKGIKIDEKIIKEIDNFIINVKEVLSKHKDHFSPAFFGNIEKTLGKLERVRTSNNINHITEICNQLYDLISNPDNISGDTTQEYKGLINSMGNNSIIKKEFDIHTKTVNLSKVQSLFENIVSKLKSIKKDNKTILSSNKVIEQNSEKKSIGLPSETKEVPSFMLIIKKAFLLLSASSLNLRKNRKEDLVNTYYKWKNSNAKPKVVANISPSENKSKSDSNASDVSIVKERADFTDIFLELDSFVSWLLFFYISYLFLVNFSLEKNIGISQEFIIKTVQTPLIVNISIFLIFAHLLFKLKIKYFRQNLIGSFFLFFFGFGTYSLLIINF